MMFPEFEFDEEIEQEIEEVEEEKEIKKVVAEFDFEKGEFSLEKGGLKLISGKERLEQWIRKVISTEKGENEIEPLYGLGLKKIIFSDYPKLYIKAEICRIIEETLCENEEILGVVDFEFIRTGINSVLSFVVETIYGNIEREVTLHA